MTYNLFFLLTGDPGRETLDPDLLGVMVKIEQGSNLLDQIFNLIARYVWKVHFFSVERVMWNDYKHTNY
jgi:hypothetical protein